MVTIEEIKVAKDDLARYAIRGEYRNMNGLINYLNRLNVDYLNICANIMRKGLPTIDTHNRIANNIEYLQEKDNYYTSMGYSVIACNFADNYNIDRILTNKSLDINYPYYSGRTLLHIAVMNGNTYLVKKLILLGANVNKPDIYGKTPISYIDKVSVPGFKALIDADAHIPADLPFNALYKSRTDIFTFLVPTYVKSTIRSEQYGNKGFVDIANDMELDSVKVYLSQYLGNDILLKKSRPIKLNKFMKKIRRHF